MDFIQSILMGIVQGLSEFLPISSSAHIVLTSSLYKVLTDTTLELGSNEEVFFDIMLHLGTLISVLIYFKTEILDITKALIEGIKTKNFSNKDAKLGLYIILGTFITILIALPLHEFAEKLVTSPIIVGILLIITGGVLFASECLSKKMQKKSNTLSLNNAIAISIAQGLAVLPGFSRSGWTIATGLFCGLDRLTGARYSFLLSIPIILGSSMVYPLVKINTSELITYNWAAIIVGTIVSGIVGYICIKYFLKFVAKFSLSIFAYYCVFIGIAAIIFFSSHTNF